MIFKVIEIYYKISTVSETFHLRPERAYSALYIELSMLCFPNLHPVKQALNFLHFMLSNFLLYLFYNSYCAYFVIPAVHALLFSLSMPNFFVIFHYPSHLIPSIILIPFNPIDSIYPHNALDPIDVHSPFPIFSLFDPLNPAIKFNL